MAKNPKPLRQQQKRFNRSVLKSTFIMKWKSTNNINKSETIPMMMAVYGGSSYCWMTNNKYKFKVETK